jgi:hypothetical protein
MMCRGAVAVVLGVGVWAFPDVVMRDVTDKSDRMIKDRLTKLFDECMDSSCGST